MTELLIVAVGWLLVAVGIALICGRSFAAGDELSIDELDEHEFWQRVDESGRFR